MQSLPFALFLVLLELTVGSFVSLYFLDVRGDSSRGFVIFQGVLYILFGLMTLGAMNAFATPEIVRGIGLDETWVRAQGPLVLAFFLLMLPWNVLLWADRQPRVKGKKAERPPLTTRRMLRFVVGGVASVVAGAALLDVAMAYRTLANSRLDGAFVVVVFLTGGIALGGVMTAMLLGHWYLNTPTASGKPLEFATALTIAALAAELAFSLAVGPSTARPIPGQALTPGTTIQNTDGGIRISTPTVGPTATVGQPGQATDQQPDTATARQAPLGQGAMWWLRFITGFLAPLVLGGVALYLTRGRSFQSATGMLYLAVAFIFLGEILGRGLLLSPLFQ